MSFETRYNCKPTVTTETTINTKHNYHHHTTNTTTTPITTSTLTATKSVINLSPRPLLSLFSPREDSNPVSVVALSIIDPNPKIIVLAINICICFL